MDTDAPNTPPYWPPPPPGTTYAWKPKPKLPFTLSDFIIDILMKPVHFYFRKPERRDALVVAADKRRKEAMHPDTYAAYWNERMPHEVAIATARVEKSGEKPWGDGHPDNIPA